MPHFGTSTFSFLLLLCISPAVLAVTKNCTEEDQAAMAIAHSKCVDDVSQRLLSGNEPHHVKVCNGLTEQVHKCAVYFENCMDEQELRYVIIY